MRIQAYCLTANPSYDGPADVCDTNVGWIKRSGSTNLGRLREASRQKTLPETKLAVVRIQVDCLAANPPYDCDANVKPIVVKRIDTWCASYRQHTLPTVVYVTPYLKKPGAQPGHVGDDQHRH
nr:hypothetical protein [Methylomarinum sp. Ch1-1]MDP4519762.1 hypothetical protein [Methylomarinum sp. Ch1-1]